MGVIIEPLKSSNSLLKQEKERVTQALTSVPEDASCSREHMKILLPADIDCLLPENRTRMLELAGWGDTSENTDLGTSRYKVYYTVLTW